MKLPVILFLFLCLACSNDRSAVEQQNPKEQTPEVLEGGKSVVDYSSYRKSNDIIQQLFEEAINKDENLKSISGRIEKFDELKADSLEAYQDYINNNENYWNSITRYSNQLSDSALRKDLNKLVDGLRDKYNKGVSSLNSKVAQIDISRQALKDYEILMKIIVTVPMMSNYQRNEYPNIKSLESVKQTLDSLINDVKPYTQLQK